MAVLFQGRKSDSLRSEFLLRLFPDMYQHISNFTLSYLLIAGIGYVWILTGVNYLYISWMVLVVVVLNFIYELCIPILNTPDIVDAYYGLVGSVMAYVFLIISKRFGLLNIQNSSFS